MSEQWIVQQLDELPRRSLFEGSEFVNVTGERTSFARGWFQKGALLPSPTQQTHSHDTEEVLYIFSGAMRVWAGWDADHLEERVLRAGDVMIVPANMSHGGEVLEDGTEGVAVNAPARRDHATAHILTAP